MYMWGIHSSMRNSKDSKARWRLYIILDWGRVWVLGLQRRVRSFTGRWKESISVNKCLLGHLETMEAQRGLQSKESCQVPPCLAHPVHTFQFSPSVVSNSLLPYGLQHTRLPWTTPSPRICSNSSPLSQRCHSTISSFVTPFSFCPQSFLASGSFPMSWLFLSGGQSIGPLTTVLPMNIKDWFILGLTDLISL